MFGLSPFINNKKPLEIWARRRWEISFFVAVGSTTGCVNVESDFLGTIDGCKKADGYVKDQCFVELL